MEQKPKKYNLFERTSFQNNIRYSLRFFDSKYRSPRRVVFWLNIIGRIFVNTGLVDDSPFQTSLRCWHHTLWSRSLAVVFLLSVT